MKIWLFTFGVLVISLLAMAVGVILGGKKKSLKGSCGGLNKVLNTPGNPCDFCGRRDLCEDEKEFEIRVKKRLDPLI